MRPEYYVPIAAYISLYVIGVILLSRRAWRSWARARAVWGLRFILLQQPSAETAARISRVLDLYEELRRRYGARFAAEYPTATDLVRHLIFVIQAWGPTASAASGTKPERKRSILPFPFSGRALDEALRDLPSLEDFSRVLEQVLGELRQRDPFAGLTGRRGPLLQSLVEAMNSSSHALFDRAIAELNGEIRALESDLRQEAARNTRATIWSVVGAVLTLVFGGVSLWQFLTTQ